MNWQEPTECSLCNSADIFCCWEEVGVGVSGDGLTNLVIAVYWDEIWRCNGCKQRFASRQRREFITNDKE
jgi:hypothetical protein